MRISDWSSDVCSSDLIDTMKTELDHLPANKRRELDRVIQILFEEFEDAHGQPTGPRKLGRILKIILYGSYATGRWVHEPHRSEEHTSEIQSLMRISYAVVCLPQKTTRNQLTPK